MHAHAVGHFRAIVRHARSSLVNERTKGIAVLVASAVIAAVVLQIVRREPEATPAAASASPSGHPSASAPVIPPPRIPTRAELERTIEKLGGFVKAGASDPASPWALAHGLVAFGASHTAEGGKSAVDTIASFAEPREPDGGKTAYLFPERRGAGLVEPHRHLLVKSLLEVDVPLTRSFSASDGKRVTLARLIADAHASAKLPESDADWHHAAWLLSALALHDAKNPKAKKLMIDELRRRALDRLEADHRVVTSFSGPAARAFDPGTPLHDAKQKKTGIYGHSCGGLHFVQGVMRAVALAADQEELRRVARQLGVLAYRYDAERSAYRTLLASNPEHGLILRVQQLKFFGHLLETLTLARMLAVYRHDTEGGKKLEAVARHAAADVVDVVSELDRGGVYHRLDAIRKEREQTYLDLIGDGCHAIHALRDALPLFAPSGPPP
jgi:hypothetical protein